MKNSILLLFMSLFCCLTIYGQPSVNEIKPIKINESLLADKVDYFIWDSILRKYIMKNGLVDYKGLKDNEIKLNKFLKILSNAKIDNSWSNNDKIAYWINVYNAFTIKFVLRNYPMNSIKDTTDPWGQEFFTINGVLMSLGHVEHKILRKFGDPRIHFAINCASLSCPRILQIPYRGRNLDSLLEKQTVEYLNNEDLNIITPEIYKLSKLFSWFGKDFKDGDKTIIDFVNKYSDIKIRDQKNKGFLKYDWNLNSM